jgi:hypothetical protein
VHNSTFKSPGKGLTRRTELQRTAFKPKADATPMRRSSGISTPPKATTKTASLRKIAISQGGGVAPVKPRSTLKSRRPPTSKIRQSAAREHCTLRLAGVCKEEEGNVVWAHSNRGEHGKGGGRKADDEHGAYACYWCHCVYDRQHPRPAEMTLEYVESEFTRAMHESRAILVRKGLILAANEPLEMLLQDVA